MLFVIRFYQRRIAQTTAALTRLKPVWNDRSISPGSKARLLCCLVTSIFLYACQSWNLPVEMRKKNMSHKYEVLPQDTTHLMQRPCYQQESPCQDPAGNRTIRRRRPPGNRKGKQTEVVWTWLPFVQGTEKGGRVSWCFESCQPQRITSGLIKEEEDKADRGRGGKTTLGNGQKWSSPSPRGQWRTRNGENWLWSNLWCNNDPRGQAIGVDYDEVRGTHERTRGHIHILTHALCRNNPSEKCPKTGVLDVDSFWLPVPTGTKLYTNVSLCTLLP